jgi:hypothetical protein
VSRLAGGDCILSVCCPQLLLLSSRSHLQRYQLPATLITAATLPPTPLRVPYLSNPLPHCRSTANATITTATTIATTTTTATTTTSHYDHYYDHHCDHHCHYHCHYHLSLPLPLPAALVLHYCSCHCHLPCPPLGSPAPPPSTSSRPSRLAPWKLLTLFQ